jgi:hypothetical protein
LQPNTLPQAEKLLHTTLLLSIITLAIITIQELGTILTLVMALAVCISMHLVEQAAVSIKQTVHISIRIQLLLEVFTERLSTSMQEVLFLATPQEDTEE